MHYQRVVWILFWFLVIQVSSSRDDNQPNPLRIIHDDVSKLTDYQKEKAAMFYPIVAYFCPTARKEITRLIVTYLTPSTIHLDGGVSLYQLSFDDQWLATTTWGRNQDGKMEYFTDETSPNNVTLWHMCTGKQHVILRGHTDRINEVIFSFATDDESLNQFIISASGDNTLIAWWIGTGERFCTFEGHSGHYYGVRDCSLTADNQRLLSVSGDGLRIWLVQTGECEMTIQRHKDENSIEYAKFCHHDERIILWWQTHIELWTVGTRILLRQMDFQNPILTNRLFNVDEIQMKVFCSDSRDRSISVWDIATETEFGDSLQTFRGHTTYIKSARFVRNNTSVVSDDISNTVCIWRMNDGVCTHRFDNCMRTVPGTYWLAEAKIETIIVFTKNEVQVLAIDSGEIIISAPMQRNNFERPPDAYGQHSQCLSQPLQVSFNGHFLIWSSDYNVINFFTFTHYKKIAHY